MEMIMKALTRMACETICEAKGVDKNIVNENWDVIWEAAKYGNDGDLEYILEKIINRG